MDYQIAELPKNISNESIPAKSRTVQKSPLAQKISSLKVGEAFLLEGAEMEKVSPNLYATARRLGVKLSLRTLDAGVGVWRVRKSRTSASSEATAETASAVAPKRRGPGRPRKDATTTTQATAKATNGQKRGPGRPRKDQSQPQARAA